MSIAEAGQALRRAIYHVDCATEHLPVSSEGHMRSIAIRRELEKLNAKVLKLEDAEDRRKRGHVGPV